MKLRGIHSYETRFSTSDCLNVPHYRLSSCQCSLLFNVVHLWNDIPATIRESHSVHAFKTRLRKRYYGACRSQLV